MASAVDETIQITELSESGEGLTAEEMELAKKILQVGCTRSKILRPSFKICWFAVMQLETFYCE